MAKLLADFPGTVLNSDRTSVSAGPLASASKTSPGVPSRQTEGRAPKALEQVGSKSTMNDHSDWMIRRCDAFGIASSRYFKKNGTCPAPVKK